MSIMSALQRLAIASAVAVWAALACAPACALVVTNMSGTTSPPADDPGWNYVTVSGSRNYVYLGGGWALTARHVGPEPSDPAQTLTYSTGTFSIIPGENYVVQNPSTIQTSSGDTISLTTQTDLRLVRLNGNPLPNPAFTIAGQSPPLSGQVTFIGHGRTREDSQYQWNSSWQQLSPPLNPPPADTQVAFTGYRAIIPSDDTKRWGTNRIANANNYNNEKSFYQILSTSTGVLSLTTGAQSRDVISLATSFDSSGLTNEAQAVDKDSGTAVFHKRNNNQWELVGIVNAILTYTNPNQPSGTAVFGNATTIADLSYYNQPYERSICDIMMSCGNYSMMGDVNIDGKIDANDVTAFVAGWQYNNGAGKGDYTSWTSGDLNLDGKVDAADFLLLRSALTAGGAGASLPSLETLLGGSAVVPEPSSMAMVFVGTLLWGTSRRRRFRPSTG